MDGVYLLRQDGLTLETAYCRYLERCGWQVIIDSPGAKVLKWRFFDHEREQAEFGLKFVDHVLEF